MAIRKSPKRKQKALEIMKTSTSTPPDPSPPPADPSPHPADPSPPPSPTHTADIIDVDEQQDTSSEQYKKWLDAQEQSHLNRYTKETLTDLMKKL